jgi:hypothetical protein
MAGCESSPFAQVVTDRFDLHYGQTAFVAGPDVRITFTGDVYDGRCCMLCYCIWEGYASITLRLEKSGKTSLIELSTDVIGGSTPPPYIDTLGYRFRLAQLLPYPEVGPYPNENYVATIEVKLAPPDTTQAEVIITDVPPIQIVDQPYDLDSAKIVGEKFRMWIHHGGGCEAHYFQLYMSPASFIDASPRQAYLYLKHFGQPDYCDALVYRELEFDLGPIIELYHSSISGGGGEVQLMMTDCYDPYLDPPCVLLFNGTLQVPSLPD